jgi:hypothetical protein
MVAVAYSRVMPSYDLFHDLALYRRQNLAASEYLATQVAINAPFLSISSHQLRCKSCSHRPFTSFGLRFYAYLPNSSEDMLEAARGDWYAAEDSPSGRH